MNGEWGNRDMENVVHFLIRVGEEDSIVPIIFNWWIEKSDIARILLHF